MRAVVGKMRRREHSTHIKVSGPVGAGLAPLRPRGAAGWLAGWGWDTLVLGDDSNKHGDHDGDDDGEQDKQKAAILFA